jgi:hypothetical protein
VAVSSLLIAKGGQIVEEFPDSNRKVIKQIAGHIRINAFPNANPVVLKPER